MMSPAAPTERVLPSTDRKFVRELPMHSGEYVCLNGWVTAVRKTKSMRFLTIRDRTGSVQAVYRDTAAELAGFDELTVDSAVRISGTVRNRPNHQDCVIEIEAETIEVLARAQGQLPAGRGAGPEEKLDYRFAELQQRSNSLIFEVQTTFEAKVREFLLRRCFVEIHTPRITASGSESGAAVFTLPYFGGTAFLAQSPQFYMQLAMAAGFDRVFDIGPVFRAELASTNRHATEFTCIDVEISWIDSHEDLMALEEEMLRHALSAVQAQHGREIERHFNVALEVPDGPIPRIPISFANVLVNGDCREAAGRLTYQAEQALCKYAKEKYGQSFVFLTNYSAADRPFYTMQDARSARDGQTVATRSFDLFWRGIELTSGCQREHRYERARAQAEAAGVLSHEARSYLDSHYFEMFRYGCPPHGGFGIGLNRLLMALLARPSIRDTSFVFRGPDCFVP